MNNHLKNVLVSNPHSQLWESIERDLIAATYDYVMNKKGSLPTYFQTIRSVKNKVYRIHREFELIQRHLDEHSSINTNNTIK